MRNETFSAELESLPPASALGTAYRYRVIVDCIQTLERLPKWAYLKRRQVQAIMRKAIGY